LFIPTVRDDLLPAVVCLHQTTRQGKDEPAGINGLPNLHYALELAQRGYVTLAPDYPSFGDYEYDFLADDYVSGTMKGIWNHMRCVDLLEARDEVDPDRIGVIGHSLGGHNAMFLAAFDERVQVAVSSCGWTPFHDYYGGMIAGWTSDRYMPKLKDDYALDLDRVPFDFYEVVAAFAPRGFFSCSPLRDSNFDVAGVKKAIPAAAEIYKLLDAEDRLQVRYPDCEHDFPPETREEAYRFIDRVLEHEPTAVGP
jgi:dienelactone hydrolase